MIIVMLLRSLNVEAHKMTCPTIFTLESDPFHKVHLELISQKNHRHTITNHLIKVHIKRKKSKENKFLHPSPQVSALKLHRKLTFKPNPKKDNQILEFHYNMIISCKF